jgi:hypothetical protein
MNQKANSIAARLSNRGSWALVLSEDKRHFSKLFVNNAQTQSFVTKVLRFFFLLPDKPLIRFFKHNLIYMPSSFITRAIHKKMLFVNAHSLYHKKIFNCSSTLTPLTSLSVLCLCDFSH